MGRSFPYSLRDQVAVTERDRVLGFHGMRSGEMAEEGKESKADDNTRREKAYLPGPYLSAVRPMNPIAQKGQSSKVNVPSGMDGRTFQDRTRPI